MPEDNRYQHYEVLKRADGSLWELGHGAMGITYKAYDTNLRCPVALKVINATYLENETARQRFLREARAAAALRQQNVASVFHLGTDHGTYFYAMEFVDGQTVDEYMKQKGRFTPLEALNIAFQVARALAAAARQQLVHRDLKPTNLMLVDEDGEQVVKVIDFGLAKSVKREGEDSGSLTVGGGFVGTPHFASPEQLEDRDLDVRSDIYSLGSTLYYLVTGRPPFSGSVAQIMSQHLYKPVPAEPLQGLPPPFINLILWMMEKDRDKRPQSATELRRAIQRCVRELGVTALNGSASAVIRALQSDVTATMGSSPASEATVEAGSVFARKYRVDEPLPDHVAGKRYRGVDLERRLTVSLLVLSREFLADALHFSALERAVDQARSAPHPGLRQVIALETAGNQTVLVEEFLNAPSLQEILRVRGRLPAAEVVAALERLVPVADHARLKGLEYLDFTLSGIQLSDPGQSRDGAGLEQWIQQPLTEWPDLTPRVAPIDFAFQAEDPLHWAGEATVVQPSGPLAGPKGSYVRRLSLLAYELLGGPRGALETQGRYIPLAALPEGGNQVLRRGLADEAGTADEFVRTLAGCLPGRVAAAAGRPIPAPATDRPATVDLEPTPLQPSGGPTDAAETNLPTVNDPALPLPAPLDVETLLAQRYRLVDRLSDTPQGCHFLADDLRRQRRVSLQVLNREVASEAGGVARLQEAVNRVWEAPHPMLRAVYDLETIAGYCVLVQEDVAGASLLDVLRIRNALSAPEIVQLLSLLAPLADHAHGHRLQHVDFTLRGIHLTNRHSTGGGTHVNALKRPLTAWESLGLRVDAIDFLFVLSPSGTGSGPATRVHGAVEGGSRGSYVRLLSLLAYELLGGLRARLEATGQYTPLATLTEGANAALRRGVINEWPSASELARQLAAVVGVTGTAASASESVRRVPPGPPRIAPVEIPAERPAKPKKAGARRLALAAGLMACVGIGAYVVYRSQAPPPPLPEFADLAVESDPPGAAITLDEGPSLSAPHRFARVPFGHHRLTANLKGYLPARQDVQVDGVTPRKLVLALRPAPIEVAALTVQTEPAGASILLDGKPPQQAPGTFTHVPFGRHRLTVRLDRYEPLSQELEVRAGMSPELRLALQPVPTELPALAVQTQPAGASVLLDGKPPQQPPNTFTRVPFGRHELTATLPGYLPAQQELQLDRATPPRIVLTLQPVPTEVAAVSIQTEPAGGSVLLDGKPPQSPAGTFTHVPFGRHRLTATLDNYEPFSEELEVHEGMSAELRLTLQPVPTELPALTVQTEPAGASLLLDGKPPQQLPNIFTHVPFGYHRLTAALKGYLPAQQELNLDRATSPQIVLTLQPVPTELAALSVQTEPAGASVLLDGKPPQQLPDTFTHVPFGHHRLTATLDGYEPLSQELEVRERMSPELRLMLQPVATELPALAVQTQPPGASVSLDGRPPQQPPNTFTRVPFGRHELTATLPGYLPAQQELQLDRATPPRIVLTLQPDPIEVLRNEVKKSERGSPQFLNAYVRLVQALTRPGQPNPQEYNELGQVIEELRTKVPPISGDEFSLSYGSSIRDAANLNILPAILWLAANENGPEAFDLFLRAANLGDSYAMMRVGRFYFRKGTPDDDKEGFAWLNRAYTAPKPNLEAGAYIGDCYLSGRGTKQDVQKAEKIILPLASQGVVPAMVLAGRILQYKAEDKQVEAGHSTGSLKQKLMAQADAFYSQAKPWWERAVAEGDWNAAAHLGQLYEKGFGGMQKNEGKAEELYKEGIEHSNVLSMYFYGLLIAEKPGRRTEAVGWIKQAATAGIPSAREWLRVHEVTFSEVTPQEDHQ